MTTLHEETTEGWPYDGAQVIVRLRGDGVLVRERTVRHIDADSERFEQEVLEPEAARAFLRAHHVSMDRVVEHAPRLLSEARLIASRGDDPREEVWFVAPWRAFFLKTVRMTTEREPSVDEFLLGLDSPLLGRVVTALHDATYALSERVLGPHEPREVVHQQWLTEGEARASLGELGVSSDEVDALLAT